MKTSLNLLTHTSGRRRNPITSILDSIAHGPRRPGAFNNYRKKVLGLRRGQSRVLHNTEVTDAMHLGYM